MVSPDWATLADTAIARVAELDNDNLPPFALAYTADAVAQRSPFGWADPEAVSYLDRLWAARLTHSDGSLRGWSSPFSAFVYTITVADHVGPALVDAHRSGVTWVGQAELLALGEVLMACPRNSTGVGWWPSYRLDASHATNVYNVTAACSLLLEQIRAAGVAVPPLSAGGTSATTLSMQYSRSVAAGYLPTPHNWAYSSVNSTVNDADHLGLLVEAVETIARPVSWHTGTRLMTTTYTGASEVHAALGHIRAGGLTLGLPYVDNWLSEAQTYREAQAGDPVRQAQVARWAARIAGGASA